MLRDPEGGKGTDTIPNLSVFYQGVPVTQYSPAIFDAFVNYTQVSSIL